jgi:hypothetical protein
MGCFGLTCIRDDFLCILILEEASSGKVLPHIIYPESMWVSYFIRSEEDASKIIDLFRLQYNRLKYKPAIARPRFFNRKEHEAL